MFLQMNKTILLSISLLAIAVSSVQSQEVIGYVNFRASYLFSYKTSTEQIEFAGTDLMLLDIGENVSRFYSRMQQRRDSVETAGIRQGLNPHEVVANMRNYARGITTVIYTKNNNFHVTDNFVIDLLYTESCMRPVWRIGTETKEIAGFVAQRATAHYLGRNWIVYFTPEIPINSGPWKLWGLPGLILEAVDEDNLFSFQLNGFEVIHRDIPIVFTTISETGRNFQRVEKESYRRMQRLFYADRVEFMRQFVMGPEGTITQTPEQAENMRRHVAAGGVPFIPLEPW